MARVPGRCCLLSDCGSTTTKVALVEERDGVWRLAGCDSAPTTVEAPTADILAGLRRAVRRLGRRLGRNLVGTSGVLRRVADDGDGVDCWLSTSSAGGGLQMLVMGVVRELTAASAEQAALGAGAVVTRVLAHDDIADPAAAVEVLRRQRPDMVLLAGGEDGGARRQVLALAELLAVARPRARHGARLPVVYAGNRDATAEVRRALTDTVDLTPVANLRPTLDREEPGPARDAIAELFLHHVMARAPGYGGFLDALDGDARPTPAAVGDILLLAAGDPRCGVAEGGLLAVDIGGATTDVFSVRQGALRRTVSANLGLSYSMANVLREAGRERVERWMAGDLTSGEIRNRVRNKSVRPTTLPMDTEDLRLEQAVAREALTLALAQHEVACRRAPEADDSERADDLAREFDTHGTEPEFGADIELLIGSGGVLSHAPDVGQAAAILLDSLQPRGVTRLALDRHFLLPHLGVLARADAGAARQVLWADCLLELGTCLAPAGDRVPTGRPLCRWSLAGGEPKDGRDPDDSGRLAARSGELEAGTLRCVPLAPGRHGLLRVEPRDGIDCGAGPGRPFERRVTGGVLGLILDGRGRPLILPDDTDERIRTLAAWRKTLSVGKVVGP